MYKFDVTTSKGSYEVEIGNQIIVNSSNTFDVVIMDSFFTNELIINTTCIPFDARESTKNLKGVEEVLVSMNQLGMRRDSAILAVGGGVVQDVATLAASLYMRGISWTYAPTTMMAMLDSCIGGKSSINTGGVKNLIGNIYPPSRVLVDIQFASSLPMEAKVSGLSEAVKICFARGPKYFEKFLEVASAPSQFGDSKFLDTSIELVRLSLETKKWFIEVDEFDNAERLLLNFGHTFAHALEAALDFSIPHGIAVAIGMQAAIYFSDFQSTLSEKLFTYINGLASELPPRLRSTLNDMNWQEFERALLSDKKSSTKNLRFVLPNVNGNLELKSFDRSDVTVKRAKDATYAALQSFSANLPDPL